MLNSTLDYVGKILADERKIKSQIAIHTPLDSTTRYYGNSIIMNFKIVEQGNVITDTLPSSEIEITLDNSNGDFDIFSLGNMHEIIASKPYILTELGLVLVDVQQQTVITNFSGKVSGSLVANPHIHKRGTGSFLLNPSAFTYEPPQFDYDKIMANDATYDIEGAITNNTFAQSLVAFDVITYLERQFGVGIWEGYTNIADKIKRATSYINNMILNFVGFGTSPLGNKTYFAIWDGVNWVNTQSHTSTTSQQLSISSTDITPFLMSNGFIYGVAYANASNGSVQSRINTNYAEMILDVEPITDLEWISTGKFYITGWKNEITNKTITFYGNDIFYLFTDLTYTPSTATNPYVLAQEILTKGGVLPGHQVIHNSLANITCNPFPEPIDLRTALQHIGILSQSVIYQGRDGYVYIIPLSQLEISGGNYYTFTTTQNVLGGMGYVGTSTTSRILTGSGMKYIDFDNMYQYPEITIEKSLYELKIKVYTNGILTDPIPEYSYYNTSIQGDSGISISIDNPLVKTEAQAQAIATYFFQQETYTANFRVDWRGNPVLEANDMILIEDSFGAIKQSRIVSLELDYTGRLKSIIESRGGQ